MTGGADACHSACVMVTTTTPVAPIATIATQLAIPTEARRRLVRHGLRIEAMTIGWNALEATLAIGSGVAAGSVALTGFGLDSVIEVVAAVALFSRLRAEARGAAAAVAERRALGFVALTFFLLGLYIALDASVTLAWRRIPEASPLGVFVAASALIVMPLLARAKRRVGEAIGSPALIAEASCSLACAWLSAAVLLGVGLNTAIGWWWADPVASLCMVPLLVREGRESLAAARGQSAPCACHAGCASSPSP